VNADVSHETPIAVLEILLVEEYSRWAGRNIYWYMIFRALQRIWGLNFR